MAADTAGTLGEIAEHGTASMEGFGLRFFTLIGTPQPPLSGGLGLDQNMPNFR
jgi:hypothetical protein